MSASLATRSIHRFVTLATIILVVAVMYWAKKVILPLALAGLIAFLLTPMVVRLHRWGLPKALAIITSALIAFSALSVAVGVVVWQTVDLVAELPDYERNIHAKIEAVKGLHGPPALDRTIAMVQEYAEELRADAPATRDRREADGERQPVPVEVREPTGSSLSAVQALVWPFLRFMGIGGIVAVFVVAMLFQREDLRDRFIQVVSAGRINLATQALDDASRRVSRYLLMQLVVNATYGIPIGLGLFFIGIPNALLWGMLATLLRFIPFLGPWIAAAFPVVLALAVDPGFGKLVATLSLFVVMELLSNNVIELMLYRAGTGISNLALLVAAVFWTWLWGPIGLFLSTPLTACMLVLGKHVPSLRVLSTMLGSDPVLKPAAQFYQRMLSMDSDEMDDCASDYLAGHTLLEFFSDVLAPALVLAEEERHRGALAEVRQQFIFSSVRELIEDLGRREEQAAGESEERKKIGPMPPASRVAIVPCGDDSDELMALMLAVLLRRHGMAVEVTSVALSPEELRAALHEFSPELVVVSALPPHATTQAVRACRLLATMVDSTPVIAGVWSEALEVDALHNRFRGFDPTALVLRLDEAIEEIRRIIALGRTAAPFPAPEETDAGQVPPLRLSGVDSGAWVDLVTRNLAGVFKVPLSMVSLVDLKSDFWPESIMAAPARLSKEEALRAFSPRGRLEPGEELLVVEDVARDARLRNVRAITDRGVRFYAGFVMRTAAGTSVGVLCVVDTRPRQLDDAERRTLCARGRELVAAGEEVANGGSPEPDEVLPEVAQSAG